MNVKALMESDFWIAVWQCALPSHHHAVCMALQLNRSKWCAFWMQLWNGKNWVFWSHFHHQLMQRALISTSSLLMGPQMGNPYDSQNYSGTCIYKALNGFLQLRFMLKPSEQIDLTGLQQREQWISFTAWDTAATACVLWVGQGLIKQHNIVIQNPPICCLSLQVWRESWCVSHWVIGREAGYSKDTFLDKQSCARHTHMGNYYILGLWQEARVPRENSCMQRENMETINILNHIVSFYKEIICFMLWLAMRLFRALTCRGVQFIKN